MSKITSKQLAATILPGESVYSWCSRMAATYAKGYCRWCPVKVMRNETPATPRKLINALSLIRGDVTSEIIAGLTGEESKQVAGADAVASFLRVQQNIGR